MQYSTLCALDVPSELLFLKSQRLLLLLLFGPLRERWSLQSREAVIFCWLCGWRKMAHLLSPTCLHKTCQALKKKEKNGEMFHVSCLFLPKAKRRAKESWDRYSDIPREDVAGMKACHFVTDDHETAPLFFFLFFFWIRLCQNLRDILFLFCRTAQNRNGTLKLGVYKPVRCVLLISDKKWKN